MRFCELRQKEVINICTCHTLGCPIDIEFDCSKGQLEALIVLNSNRFLGCFFHDAEIVVPWSCIKQIGKDIILVELPEEKCIKKACKEPS